MAIRQETQRARTAVDRHTILRDQPLFRGLLFRGLGPESIDRLCSYATTRAVPRGGTIFAKGDPGSSLYAVRLGTVKISAPSADGRDVVFNFVNEGGIFGEIALLDGNLRTANATAATDCELIVIDRRDFVPLARSQPEILLNLIEVLCLRLRHTSEQVEDLMFLHLPGRLAKVLLQLTESAKPSPFGRKVAITQREIGQITGMSRESTNKQLRSWKERKLVRLERGGIVVLAPDALATIAERDTN